MPTWFCIVHLLVVLVPTWRMMRQVGTIQNSSNCTCIQASTAAVFPPPDIRQQPTIGHELCTRAGLPTRTLFR